MGGLEKKKIRTGAFIVPPLILLILWGPPFTLPVMVLAATFLGLREFYDLALPFSQRIERVVGMGLGLLLAALLAWGDSGMISLFLVLILLVLSVLSMGTSQNLASAITSIGVSLFGILYIGFLLSHVSLIRNLPNGKAWAFFLILTVWAGDIFAFLGGSL
ncbi:MAG: hypothetical protein EHM36_07455, partial [Deltaproteobacteria bacterium]